ncbi:serine/arginine-rich splicing factor 1B-like [Styela clava]
MSRDSRVYVGNLPPDVREKDVEDLFHKYGDIKFVELKNRKGPPFAFVEFNDSRDAEDAIRGRNGYDYDGYRLRVEYPRGSGPPMRGGGHFMGGGGGGGGRYEPGRGRGGPPSKRTNHRVMISGLPPTGSWQDIKDHMREAGDVCYADVFRDGTGIVEFVNREDVKFAVKHLDDTKFKSHEGEVAYIRVKVDSSAGGGGGSRSRSRSRSRSNSRGRRSFGARGGGGGGGRSSPSYSPRRRSYSRSPKRRRSASYSPRRSRSRSR